MGTRRKYEQSFKNDVMMLIREGGKTIKGIAKEHSPGEEVRARTPISISPLLSGDGDGHGHGNGRSKRV